jgi:hypothetical protein
MAMQNLISGTISPEEKAKALEHLSEVMKTLKFRVSMSGVEVLSIFKAGKEYAPFLDKAFAALNQHPEIVPAAFPVEEYRKDYQLLKDLEPISRMVEELSESLEKTMMALGSDTMVESLEIYHAAKLNADHVPGISALVSDMALYFAKPRRSGSAAKAAVGGAGR